MCIRRAVARLVAFQLIARIAFSHVGRIIHMLPPAHEFLTSPCLSDFWLAYPAFFGLFAMLGLLAAHGMQTGLVSLLYKATARAAASIESSVNNVAVETSEVEHKSESDDLEAPKPSVEIVANPEISNTPPLGHNHGHSMHSSHLQASIYALEFGVAAHSLVIGLALGVSSGEEVVPLVIALAFHQFFEGLALGSTLCDAGFRTSRKSPLPHPAATGLTTPS